MLLACVRRQEPLHGHGADTGLSRYLPYREPNEDFRQRYARARERQADVLAGQILEISDDGTNDYTTTDNGDEIPNHEHIQRSRLRVDSRKWLASKLAPKKYGEKIAAELSGPDGGPVHQSLTVEYVRQKD